MSNASSTTPSASQHLLRQLPSVDKLLNHPSTQPLLEQFGRAQVLNSLRHLLERQRRLLKTKHDRKPEGNRSEESLLESARQRLEEKFQPKLCRVINATGVILHTGLGRAVLAPAVIDAISKIHGGYSLLEADRESGERGIRETAVVGLLKEITGAEAATVVNNNAGATLICLATLARGKEVIVSRGQLVEIGGSFRIPEVMEASGAKLVEVGTTNKTYLRDYERKINENTALLLRVHTSNYRIVGFTHTVGLDELVQLGKKHRLPVMDDLGSGALLDLSPWGITDEPLVQKSVEDGADLVTFSGDKLLGGPQAGIIVGTQKYVSKIRAHPLFRALRPDKLTLTALEVTLKLFLNPEKLLSRHPTLRMITTSAEALAQRAQALAQKLKAIPSLKVEVLADTSEVGGGSVPALNLPTHVVAVQTRSPSLDKLAALLRQNSPSIFTRIKGNKMLFDIRTLLEGEEADIEKALLTTCTEV